MGWFDRLFKRDRKFWFVCHTCMQQTDHDTLKSVFYYEGPPVYILGRPLTECPRCKGTNTRSFQQLKEEGSDAALWGLEQLVRKHPRCQFEIHSTEVKVGSQGASEGVQKRGPLPVRHAQGQRLVGD